MSYPYHTFSNEELDQMAHDIVCDRDGEPMNDYSRAKLRGVYGEMRRRNLLSSASEELPFPGLDLP